MHVHGGCHCGKVTFKTQTDPDKVMICNCAACQTLSGAPFRAIAHAPIKSFQVVAETKAYVKVAESGSNRAQVFCPECATPLYSSAVKDPAAVILRLGCITERDQLTPSFQLWQRSAAPWLQELGSIPGVPTQLPPQ
jgi:hypothetical protein